MINRKSLLISALAGLSSALQLAQSTSGYPEEMDEEWLMMQEDEEGDEPFCNCSTGHGIEEMDWNQCDSCGKPIYDEEDESE